MKSQGEVRGRRRSLLTRHGRSQTEKGTRGGGSVDWDQIGIGDGVIREGTGAPRGSRRIKTDLESFLKERGNVRLIHANVSPRFQ